MNESGTHLFTAQGRKESSSQVLRRWLTNKKVIAAIAGVLVLIVIIVVVVVVTTKSETKSETTPGTNSTEPATPGSSSAEPTTPEPTTVGPPARPNKLECVVTTDSEEKCTKSGCIWTASPEPDEPKCFFPSEPTFGFKFEEYDVETGTSSLRVSKGSFFGKDFQKVMVKITNYNENIVRIQFLDPDTKRYEVPVELSAKVQPSLSNDKIAYDVELVTDPDKFFSFKISRKQDNTTIFDSSVGNLFLAERHIEVTTKLPSKNVYGIGESTHKTYRHDLNHYNKWPLFSRDQLPDPWDGAGRYNLYGVHPYYMCLEDSGKSHGVLFWNSNAMEFTLTPMPALNFRSSGGVLDMFFFVGDNPEHVTKLYTQVIGRPMIPPYWGLGFQLSHYGFNTLDNMRKTINRTRNAGFPLDVIHADIDLMEERKDFTWDNTRFPNYNDFVKQEKEENGLRFIIIVDPALLANDSNYAPYQTGLDADVYITWPVSIPVDQRNNPPYPNIRTDKNIMFGQVWPKGPVAFPDFFKESTKQWWDNCIRDYRAKLDFDAIWIDMNEPSSFGTDQDRPWFCPPQQPNCWALKCPKNQYDQPENTFEPAAISVYSPKVRLSDKTICMAAVQGNNGEFVHYDVHSLYGWSETEGTYNALKDTAKADQVPLVISRSTFPSSGRHSGHWLGDNRSTWNSMRSSIVGMLEFNLFGIPYIGADICGFIFNTTSELCGRWMQVGAFYPFCRNHNSLDTIDQDPGSPLLSDRDRTRARLAMETRYQLLPYLHTLHFLAHTTGSTVVRALFHEFPTDTKTYDNQEQFMWGPSLLISPALYEGATNLSAYLPDDVWYDFYEGTQTTSPGAGRTITVTNLEIVPLHVRGGSILVLKDKGAKSTKDSRTKNFEIRVYPKNKAARGDLYIMAEEAKDIDDPKFYRQYSLDLNQTKLTVALVTKEDISTANKQTVGTIVIYDQDSAPKTVKCQNEQLKPQEFVFNATQKSLTIKHSIDLAGLKSAVVTTLTVEWS